VRRPGEVVVRGGAVALLSHVEGLQAPRPAGAAREHPLLRGALRLGEGDRGHLVALRWGEELAGDEGLLVAVVGRHLQQRGRGASRPADEGHGRVGDEGRGVVVRVASLVRVDDEERRAEGLHQRHEAMGEADELQRGLLVHRAQGEELILGEAREPQRREGLLLADACIGLARGRSARSAQRGVPRRPIRDVDDVGARTVAQQPRGAQHLVMRVRGHEEDGAPQRLGWQQRGEDIGDRAPVLGRGTSQPG
jgi:hypothetical protein